MTAICYKVKNPVVYNKGTDREKKQDTFLAYLTFKKIEDAQKEAEKMNREHPEKYWNGETIDWKNIDKFFAEPHDGFEG